MKKVLIVVLILLLLFLSGVYMLIPKQLHVTETRTVDASLPASFRMVAQLTNWTKWLPVATLLPPDTKNNPSPQLLYANDTLTIAKQFYNDLLVTLNPESDSIQTSLVFIPQVESGLIVTWAFTAHTSLNPFKRLAEYQQAINTKKMMAGILDSMAGFIGKQENLYGLSITETSTTDTILVSTSVVLSSYPGTEAVYKEVNKLRSYLAQSKAEQTGHPMLNITPVQDGKYKMMVALPVNRIIASSGDISYKRMVPGRFITATVQGGYGTLQNAYYSIQQYMNDHKRVAPGIPFEVLITDRSKTKDSSRWTTKLYFPVM